MFDCDVVVCMKLTEIWNFLEVKWEGIKGLSQTFIFLHSWPPWIQILFKYKTLERRWHDFFHLIKWKGYLKIFEFHLEIFQIQKLYATQLFSWEKIKWLLQNIWNTSWELKGSNLKSFWNYFQFGVIWILFKLFFFSKNNIYGN